MFQSTRPRGARPKKFDVKNGLYLVSIHAPARGATILKKINRRLFNVSIHAPARGATLSLFDILKNYQVSIHAPARGATCTEGPARMKIIVSIHAPARGATLSNRWTVTQSKFQSTRPRGARLEMAGGFRH